MQVPLMSLPPTELQYLKLNSNHLHSIIYNMFKDTFKDMYFKLETYIKDDMLHIISNRDIVEHWRDEYYKVTGEYSDNDPGIYYRFVISKILNELSKSDLSLYIKNNTEEISEKPEKIEEEMYNNDVKNMLVELNKSINTINKTLLLLVDTLKDKKENN